MNEQPTESESLRVGVPEWWRRSVDAGDQGRAVLLAVDGRWTEQDVQIAAQLADSLDSRVTVVELRARRMRLWDGGRHDVPSIVQALIDRGVEASTLPETRTREDALRLLRAASRVDAGTVILPSRARAGLAAVRMRVLRRDLHAAGLAVLLQPPEPRPMLRAAARLGRVVIAVGDEPPSRRIVSWSARLARRSREVVVVHVESSVGAVVAMARAQTGWVPAPASVPLWLEESFRRRMQTLEARLQAAGVHVRTQRRAGNVVEEVGAAALEHFASLVIVGSRPQSDWMSLLAPSLGELIVLETGIPVLVVP